MTAPAPLDPAWAWPRERIGEALAAVDRTLRGGESPRAPNPALDLLAGPALGRWLEASARRLGLDASVPDERARGLPDLLPAAAALIARRDNDSFLVIIGPVRPHDRTVTLATPDGVREAPALALEEDLFRTVGGPAALLSQLGVDERRELAARRALRAVTGGGLKGEGWVVEEAPHRFATRARQVGVPRLIVTGLIGFAAQLGLFAFAWALVGTTALQGRLEPGALAAFGLVLITMVALRARAAGALAHAMVLLSGLVRQRLLEGILRLRSGELRARGVGQLLGAVLEVDALELLARAGGPALVWSLFDLALGAWLLAAGAGGALHLGLLALWLAVTALGLRRLHRRLQNWTDARLALTHELCEALVGHRTLVAQDAGGHHQAALHASLDRYEAAGERLDATTASVTAFLPRGFLVLGVLGLLPAFIDRSTGGGALAVALGGVLLIWGAFRRLTEAGPALAMAAVAWRSLRFLFAAANRQAASSADVLVAASDEAAVGRRGLLVGRDVSFRYDDRPEPVLAHSTFSIQRGDRVLVDGPSGGGKSTLAALLTGLRQPTSGVLLLGGFDHHSVGPERWRQRASGVPQFHENHVFAASLLFNLLLGRRWPPRAEDFAAAEAVCRELELGPLVDRMPAGLNQAVGDSGWQLSHGERSRLFIARSLLQGVDVRVFDESIAALDPETALRVLAALRARPEALVLIAHR